MLNVHEPVGKGRLKIPELEDRRLIGQAPGHAIGVT